MVSERTGKEVEPSVLKTFPLTVAGMKKPQAFRRAATAQPSSMQAPGLLDRPIRRQSVMPSGNTHQLSQPAAESENDLMKFRTWARNAITSQQNDIDRIQGAVSRLERMINSFQDFMVEVRNEMTVGTQSRDQMNEEALAPIREDIMFLRKHIRTTEHRVAVSLGDVTDGVQKPSSEVNEFNGVTEELQYLKRRIESLEAGSRGAFVPTVTREMGSPILGRDGPGRDQGQNSSMAQAGPKTPSLHVRQRVRKRAPKTASCTSPGLRKGPGTWSYTGLYSLPSVRSAILAFGMNFTARTTSKAIDMLETYVNESQQQNTPNGLMYGTITPGDGDMAKKSELPKRTHDEMGEVIEDSFGGKQRQSPLPQKIRKISAGSAKQNAVADETPSNIHDRPTTPEVSAIGPLSHELSPILGDFDNQGEFIYARDELDTDYRPSHSNTQDSSKQLARRSGRASLTTATANTAPKSSDSATKPSAAEPHSALNKENEKEAQIQMEARNTVHEAILPPTSNIDESQVLMSAPPTSLGSATARTQSTSTITTTSGNRYNGKPFKPFKCGVCCKRWKNFGGLQYVSIKTLPLIALLLMSRI